MTAGWWSVGIAVVSAGLLVWSQVWERTALGWGPLLPLLAGLFCAAGAGLVGLIGLLIELHRGGRSRLDLGLSGAGLIFGLVCLALVFR